MEEERIRQYQDEVVQGGIKKIEEVMQRARAGESRIRAEAKMEVIEQKLKSGKYEQLEVIDDDLLSLEVLKLKEYDDKYENEHEEEIKVDDKYMKIMEDMYKMQEELDDLYNEYSVPEFSNPQE